jgi:anthranilate phosphoribosyltransferase
MTVPEAIAKLLRREHLSPDEMASVIGDIMDGRATPAQIGGLLVALRAKGETVDELAGAAAAMCARALPLTCPDPRGGIDTCGTGGDGSGTVNISTLAAIVIAACGGVVAKHGNRAQSSKCGSADVLEALGIIVDAEPEHVERAMRSAGIGFAFAPRFHAATRYANGPRRELGTRTIFNLLGPLTNPARVRHQVVGVFAAAWCEPVASALGVLGRRRAAVVHGEGGIDELGVRGCTKVALWDEDDRRVHSLELSPSSFAQRDLDPAGLAGGDAAHNAAILRDVLGAREIGSGQRLEAVLCAAAMTAALGLELLEQGPFERARLPSQYARAVASVTSGAAAGVLERWREVMAT